MAWRKQRTSNLYSPSFKWDWRYIWKVLLTATSTKNRKSDQYHLFVHISIIYTNLFWSMESTLPTGILNWLVMLGCSIFPLFSTITITFDFSNWLFTNKGESYIHGFSIFPTDCSDIWRLISNHICWSKLLFAHFYHISQGSIFHLVCSHHYLGSSSIALKCLSKAELVRQLFMAVW